MQKLRGGGCRSSPDDGALWLGTGAGHAGRAAGRQRRRRPSTFQRNATSAGLERLPAVAHRRRRAPRRWRVLAAGLDRRDLFRPALQAYEASLALVNSAAVQAEYDDLKARKGFRVVDHTVDADNPRRASARSSPRTWSRPASTMRSSSPSTTQRPRRVEAKDKQICVEGLEHGQHYNIDLPRRPAGGDRRGRWQRRSCSTIYIQDRAPSARFTGDSFVLPATARRGIPVVTVNMRRGRHEALPHRRPLAGAASVRLPVPAASSTATTSSIDRRPDGRAGLGGQARHRQRSQQGGHHQLPGRRGAARAQARRLCADRAAGERPAATTGSRAPRNGSSSPTSASRPIPARTG